jgi:hypothetical protein
MAKIGDATSEQNVAIGTRSRVVRCDNLPSDVRGELTV